MRTLAKFLVIAPILSVESAAYIKIDGIEGEALMDGQRGFIRLVGTPRLHIRSGTSTSWNDGADARGMPPFHYRPLPYAPVKPLEPMGYELSAGGGGLGGPAFHPIVVTKRIDQTTPLLMSMTPGCEEPATPQRGNQAPVPASPPRGATLLLCEGPGAGSDGGGCYLRYELKNVLVTSYTMGGDADDRPTETISLNFEEIKVTYLPEDKTPTTCYNEGGKRG
jgi:type VI protein secretion system component Hcp